jgi:hypothetical protein
MEKLRLFLPFSCNNIQVKYQERNVISSSVTLYLPVWLIRWTSEDGVKFGFCGHCTVVELCGSEPSRVCRMQPLILRQLWLWPSCVCVSHPWCEVKNQTKELSSLQSLGNSCLRLTIKLIILSRHLPLKLSLCKIFPFSRLLIYLRTRHPLTYHTPFCSSHPYSRRQKLQWSKNKQDRRCTYKRYIEARSRNLCCRVKVIINTYSECVAVA